MNQTINEPKCVCGHGKDRHYHVFDNLRDLQDCWDCECKAYRPAPDAETVSEPQCGQCGFTEASHGTVLHHSFRPAETVEAVKTELLPCPFCGQAEVGIRAVRGRFHLRKGDDPEYQAICRECLATSAPQASIGIARTAWNTRTDAALTDRVRELGRASERYRSLGDAMVKWISDLPNNIKEALPREHVLRLSEIRQAALAKEAHGE